MNPVAVTIKLKCPCKPFTWTFCIQIDRSRLPNWINRKSCVFSISSINLSQSEQKGFQASYLSEKHSKNIFYAKKLAGTFVLSPEKLRIVFECFREQHQKNQIQIDHFIRLFWSSFLSPRALSSTVMVYFTTRSHVVSELILKSDSRPNKATHFLFLFVNRLIEN